MYLCAIQVQSWSPSNTLLLNDTRKDKNLAGFSEDDTIYFENVHEHDQSYNETTNSDIWLE